MLRSLIHFIHSFISSADLAAPQNGELSAAVVSVVIHLSLQEVNFFFIKFIIEQETFHKLPEVSLCDNVMIW